MKFKLSTPENNTFVNESFLWDFLENKILPTFNEAAHNGIRNMFNPKFKTKAPMVFPNTN